jgi:hypothetical protein
MNLPFQGFNLEIVYPGHPELFQILKEVFLGLFIAEQITPINVAFIVGVLSFGGDRDFSQSEFHKQGILIGVVPFH